MDGSNIDTVLVAGAVRKRDGKLVGVDLKRIADPRDAVARLSGEQGGRRVEAVAYSCASQLVMAGLVPAVPLREARCPPNRDRRDKPGDDEEDGSIQ